MSENDEKLLFETFCQGLPYGIKCWWKTDNDVHDVVSIMKQPKAIRIEGERLLSKYDGGPKVVAMWTNLKSVKPYLFPLSSMSAKQFEEFQSVLETISNSNFLHRFAHNLIDWYNKNHFDYRGLIPLGLAIDCTNLNIY